METSIRNHLKGKITQITEGAAVSELELETAIGTISSVITTRSMEEMGLAVGQEVCAVIKSTEVGIERC